MCNWLETMDEQSYRVYDDQCWGQTTQEENEDFD
jgi:hypothetical protein